MGRPACHHAPHRTSRRPLHGSSRRSPSDPVVFSDLAGAGQLFGPVRPHRRVQPRHRPRERLQPGDDQGDLTPALRQGREQHGGAQPAAAAARRRADPRLTGGFHERQRGRRAVRPGPGDHHPRAAARSAPGRRVRHGLGNRQGLRVASRRAGHLQRLHKRAGGFVLVDHGGDEGKAPAEDQDQVGGPRTGPARRSLAGRRRRRRF